MAHIVIVHLLLAWPLEVDQRGERCLSLRHHTMHQASAEEQIAQIAHILLVTDGVDGGCCCGGFDIGLLPLFASSIFLLHSLCAFLLVAILISLIVVGTRRLLLPTLFGACIGEV